MRPTRLEINLSNLKYNIKEVKNIIFNQLINYMMNQKLNKKEDRLSIQMIRSKK